MNWLHRGDDEGEYRKRRDAEEKRYLCSLTKDELIDRYYRLYYQYSKYDEYYRDFHGEAIDWANKIRKSCR